MYNLELINWFLSANNFLRVRSEEAPFILNRRIDDVPDGMYIGVESDINSPLLNHLAAAISQTFSIRRSIYVKRQ